MLHAAHPCHSGDLQLSLPICTGTLNPTPEENSFIITQIAVHHLRMASSSAVPGMPCPKSYAASSLLLPT